MASCMSSYIEGLVNVTSKKHLHKAITFIIKICSKKEYDRKFFAVTTKPQKIGQNDRIVKKTTVNSQCLSGYIYR